MTQEGKSQEGETPRKLTLKEALAEFIGKKQFVVHTVLGSDGRRRKFPGIYLASYDTAWDAGRQQTRWDEWNLYALKSGRYLLAHEYHTAWEGEYNEYDYEILDSLQQVSQSLLDELRDRLCKELNVAIPLADVALPLEGEEI